MTYTGDGNPDAGDKMTGLGDHKGHVVKAVEELFELD